VGDGERTLEDLVAAPACRLCGAELHLTFADLGVSPLANALVDPADLGRGEVFYPLHAYVCERCLLVQLPVWEAPEQIFGDYAYFSSVSDSWVEHARRYVESVVARFGLDERSLVLEIASNDGYLLQFVAARGIPALGVEPAANVAATAVARGIETVVAFFDARLAEELRRERGAADLVVGNNVLAHVPDVHSFVEGLRIALAPGGVVTMEFPHLLRLIEERQFDTIYHEHFSYFSLLVVERLFAEHGLAVFDVEELPTHGGSLRIYAAADGRADESAVTALREREAAAGLGKLETYLEFDTAVRAAKRDLLEFLIGAKREGKSIVAYGAAAKGVTLLNYCGIGTDVLDYVVDRSPHKQGRFLPGTRLPIHAPERVRETRPDLLLILPWNLRDEIVEQMAWVRDFGCRFVIPVPRVEVVD
jgi:SAM-dependent methyltransferase